MKRVYLCGLLLAVGTAAQATTVNVQEVGTSPYQIVSINTPYIPYSGGVYAGVVNLNVDGVSTIGFCIDPFHFSNASSVTAPYDVVNLADAPKPPGPMGSDSALEIEKLWGYAFSLAPNISAANAAALQVAIWKVVSAAVSQDYPSYAVTFGNENGVSTLADSFISAVTAADYGGPIASLVGLTSVDPSHGQDYVVQSVPDGGGTVGMLGAAFIVLIAVNNRKKFASPQFAS